MRVPSHAFRLRSAARWVAVSALSAGVTLTVGCGAESSDYSVFQHDGAARRYILHIPSGLPEGAPLVFVLHGYGSDALTTREYTGFDDVADIDDFAVVYPLGSEDRDGVRHWNARIDISDVDDVGFLSSLARHLQGEHALSVDDTFVTGFSNGGFMSYVLAMDAPEVFHAAASVTGTMSGDAWENRADSSARFPLLQISGLKDRRIPIDGSLSVEGGWGGAPSIDDIIDYWIQHNTCDDYITESVNANAELHVGGGCDDGVEIWHLMIDGLAHEWPATDNSAGLVGAQFVWDFFCCQRSELHN